MISRFACFIRPFTVLFGLAIASGTAFAEPRRGIAMHGDPALPEGFSAFPHVRADAPKGGRIVFGVQGTFDTLNPFVVRGIAAQGIAPPNGYVIQSLMMRAADEPFSLYAGVAASIETPEDRSWVVFRLDPRARFSDGKPVTSADVLFSWQLLKDKGKPTWRGYYDCARRILDLYVQQAGAARICVQMQGEGGGLVHLGFKTASEMMPTFSRHLYV